jgi:hypothetical protein
MVPEPSYRQRRQLATPEPRIHTSLAQGTDEQDIHELANFVSGMVLSVTMVNAKAHPPGAQSDCISTAGAT